jgi:hypothetical protein
MNDWHNMTCLMAISSCNIVDKKGFASYVK